MRVDKLVQISLLSLPLLSASGVQGYPAAVEGQNKHSRANDADSFIQRLLGESSVYRSALSHSLDEGSNATLKVGIVGAGAAGLYSAILLQSIGVDYEILEANTRVGGRIWTHRFDEDAWAKSKPGEPEYYNYYVSYITSLLSCRRNKWWIIADCGGRMLGRCASPTLNTCIGSSDSKTTL